MKLEDFEPRVPTARDGQKLDFLWAKHIFIEAQKGAWAFWIKIGSSGLVGLAAAVSLWTITHGTGK